MHEIHVTPDFKPKCLKAYKVPELLKPEVARQLQELLDLGFICPSTSEMASLIVCVLKNRDAKKTVFGSVAISVTLINSLEGMPTQHPILLR